MKNRLEYKYLVSTMYLEKLRTSLLGYLDYDDYASIRPSKEYTVRSIYLDSFDYKCYYEKLDGIHTRKKLRIRGYNQKEENPRVFFEIKRKNDNFVSKDRARVPIQDIRKTLRGSNSVTQLDDEEKKYLNNFFFYYQLRHLEPKVLVVYEREPFQCKFGSHLRVTIDKNLRSKVVYDYDMLFDEEGLTGGNRKEFILEIKFYQVLPQWIDKVIGEFDLTRIAVSKYTSCIDMQHRFSISLNKSIRNDFDYRIQ
ncbi:MAG: polyphosphate polymerase domain-containing protein [Bacteroidota bacterium]